MIYTIFLFLYNKHRSIQTRNRLPYFSALHLPMINTGYFIFYSAGLEFFAEIFFICRIMEFRILSPPELFSISNSSILD